VNVEPIEVGAGVQLGLERARDRRAIAKEEAKLGPCSIQREGAEFEDGRQQPQLASGSCPSLGDQEKRGQTSVRDGVQTPILSLNQSGRPIVRGGRKWYSTGR
jgi:hypothetical protein